MSAPMKIKALHLPIRSCAGCRVQAPREQLLRFVYQPELGRVVFDPTRVLPGRGLYCGPSPDCLRRAHKRGAFQRQWRLGLSPEDVEVLIAQTALSLRNELRGYLLAAQRRGGFPVVAKGASPQPPCLALLWENEAFEAMIQGLEPGAASNTTIYRKCEALMSAVTQFTFAKAGAIKRRLEPSGACEALSNRESGEHRVSA